MGINLNDGDVHTIEEIDQAGREETAKNFAEGNPDLEKILLNLWEMGIHTRACCKGTNEKNHNHGEMDMIKIPYISIDVSRTDKNKILSLIKYIHNERGSAKPNITFERIDLNTNGYLNSPTSFSVLLIDKICLTNKKTERMFKLILNAVSNMKENVEIKEDKKIKPAVEMIDSILSDFSTKTFIKKVSVSISHNGNAYFSHGSSISFENRSKITAHTLNSIISKCELLSIRKEHKKTPKLIHTILNRKHKSTSLIDEMKQATELDNSTDKSSDLDE